MLGRAGFKLETFKLSIYIGLPVFAAVIFNEPETVKYFVDHFKYVEYPATVNTSDKVKKDINEKINQRQIYTEQLRRLDEKVNEHKLREVKRDNGEDDSKSTNSSWWRSIIWFPSRRNSS